MIHMQNSVHIQSLIDRFDHFVVEHLRIEHPWSKSDREYIADTIDETVLSLAIETEEGHWRVAGLKMSHPKYDRDDTARWLGPKVIASIQRSLEEGYPLRKLRHRSLDLVALTLGYLGYRGYVQRKTLPLPLLETAEIVQEKCCVT